MKIKLTRILMLAFVAFSLMFAGVAGADSEVWVDDDGGTGIYTTITAGIIAVDEGGVVNVAAGTYAENVVINKTISLLGAQCDIESEGLTSRGDESVIFSGQVEINAGGAILNGFKLSNNRIFINGASDVTVSYNIVEGSSMHGIRLDPNSPNATITYNTIVSPVWGGICNYVGNSGVIISYNHIRNVTDQHAIVSGMHTGPDIQITHNVITKVVNAKGINYWGAPGAVINHNNISGTDWEAIFTDTTATIQGNEITSSSINGINLYPGADESVVNGNIISCCAGDGILVLATDVSVVKNTISDCKNGIWVQDSKSR
ncbi:MAG: right-handed parallel beta-helix repeat-containing protein [Desulfobulbaceae bacterium]|nr:right-handed parallel beta-helix repeat-containing protein [Desulfobulbaceae bacterium]